MSSPSQIDKEDLLLGFKYPRPLGMTKGGYYGEARAAIRQYHKRQNNGDALRAVELELDRARPTDGEGSCHRIDNNVRVIRAYEGRFWRRKFEPQAGLSVSLISEGVKLILKPDMTATEKGKLVLVRFAFGRNGATNLEIYNSLQMLDLYVWSAGLNTEDYVCETLVIADGTTHRHSDKVSKRFEAKLRADMRMVKALWPTITPKR
jgi:hypothetical protein